MKNYIFFGSLFFVMAASAQEGPVVKYASTECTLSVDSKNQKTVSTKFMNVMIDGSLARFTQIQFGDQAKKIQYQLLIEKDAKVSGGLLVLQNFLVGSLESSAEFTSKDLQLVKIRQGIYEVQCSIKAQN